MGRLVLVALAVAVFIAIVAVLGSLWSDAVSAGNKVQERLFGADGDNVMAPTGMQKIAYVALIVILFGVSAGWLGGM